MGGGNKEGASCPDPMVEKLSSPRNLLLPSLGRAELWAAWMSVFWSRFIPSSWELVVNYLGSSQRRLSPGLGRTLWGWTGCWVIKLRYGKSWVRKTGSWGQENGWLREKCHPHFGYFFSFNVKGTLAWASVGLPSKPSFVLYWVRGIGHVQAPQSAGMCHRGLHILCIKIFLYLPLS